MYPLKVRVQRVAKSLRRISTFEETIRKKIGGSPRKGGWGLVVFLLILRVVTSFRLSLIQGMGNTGKGI